MVVNLLERVLFIGKIKKPIRRKKPELLRGGQPFGKGSFHWKNQENQEEEKRKKKHKLLRGGQPFGKGTFHWKNQETQEKKERTLVN